MTIASAGAAGFATGVGTTLAVPYSSTAGNLLVAFIGHNNGAVTSVTDTAGNVWTLLAATDTQVNNASTGARRVQIAYCMNAAHVTSVTVAVPSGGVSMHIAEFSGGINNLIGATSAGGSSTTATAAIAGATAGSLVVGCMGVVEVTAGTRLDTLQTAPGYTELKNTNISTASLSSAYSVRAANGSSGPAWTMTSGTWGVGVACFSVTASITNISFVGQATGSTTGTTCTVTYSNKTTGLANTAVAMAIQHQGGAISSITDSAGNLWSIVPDTYPASANRRVAIAVCKAPAHFTSVTIVASGAVVLAALIEVEAPSPIRVRGSNSNFAGTGTAGPSPVTGVLAGDWVFGALTYLETTPGTRLDTLDTSGGYAEGPGFNIAGTGACLFTASSLRAVDGASGPSWAISSGTWGVATIGFRTGANASPVANAGDDVSNVECYTSVLVNGGSSYDPDGTLSSVSWAQTGGSTTGVVITGGNTLTPTIYIPGSATAQTRTFTLTVTDNDGGTATDSMVIASLAASRQVARNGVWTPALRARASST